MVASRTFQKTRVVPYLCCWFQIWFFPTARCWVLPGPGLWAGGCHVRDPHWWLMSEDGANWRLPPLLREPGPG